MIGADPDPLRVLFVAAHYFPYVGGVETHVREVGRRLAAAGNDVTVLSIDPNGDLPADERVEGVRTLRVGAWLTRGDYNLAPEVYRTIVRGHWDIIHCQGYNTLVAPLAMLGALRTRTPYIVTFHSGGHSSRLRNGFRGVQQAVLRPLLARAERLVAVSTFEAELFGKRLRLPSERFVVIPNGSHLPEMAPYATRRTGGTLIMSVGRLERYKGHHRVIAAMPRVLEQCQDARLQIVGTGTFEGALRRLASKLGVAERVEFVSVGASDRKAMAELFAAASLVTLLSEYEAHPIAVMEALAMGRSVLVSYTSGLAELADRGLVRSVAAKSSVDQVAEALLYSLRYPLVPEGANLPTWEECTARLEALYRSVLRRDQCTF